MASHSRWLGDIIPLEALGQPLHIARSIEVVERPPAEMCLACRGARLLCGKSRCPILVKAEALARRIPQLDSDRIDGSTPPGIFVGRFGYPKVYVGPLVPPYHGDTMVLDTPEWWMGKTIDDIIAYRYDLVRGNQRMHVFTAQEGSALLDTMQELAMADQPVDAELQLTKKPRKTITLSEDSQPFGPSAPLKAYRQSTVHVDRRIERAYYDRDLKAAEAVGELYREGVLVTRMQRAFSAGMFGVGGARKLVPTRWSITAVDSTLSLQLIDAIKQNDTVDAYYVYHFRNLDNLYVALLFPEPWKYEWIEAWFPNTAWNQFGRAPALMGDYEEHGGRTTYASVGGCYYAVRLAAVEHLQQLRRQAAVLILREIHPGYILPVGVWNVRESVRAMFQTTPQRFDSQQAALTYAFQHLTISPKHWLATSTLLQRALYQQKISKYFPRVAQ